MVLGLSPARSPVMSIARHDLSQRAGPASRAATGRWRARRRRVLGQVGADPRVRAGAGTRGGAWCLPGTN